ncbi:glycosyltransferase family 4 protein [Halosimplex halobium]|uniref:glycosyltransferase family 4 protein n=1 Tax=Halosimplex halobium TaxID=3396618 RepID=UPI003F57F712
MDELIVLKPESVESEINISTEGADVRVLDFPLSRQPILKPRLKIAVYPFWVLAAIIVYLRYVRTNGHVDVLHAIDHPFSSATAQVLSRLTGVPYVASVRGLHGLSRDDGNDSSPKLSISFFLNQASPLSLRGVDHLITKSEYQQEYLADEFGLSGTPMTAIPTGVDFTKFDPSATQDTGILDGLLPKSAQGKRIVLFIGRLTEGKGVDVFVDHIASADIPPDVHFLIVGEFSDDQFESEVRKRVEEDEIEEYLTLYPEYVSFDYMPELLSAVDAVSLFSLPDVEGVPRVLQEAVALETPILAADVTGISGVFAGQDGCFLIERTDSDAFERALQRIGEVKPTREDFHDLLDMDRNYRRYVDVYREVLR